MGFFSKRVDALRECFIICVAEYCIDETAEGTSDDKAFGYMLGAFAAYQVTAGGSVRERLIGDASELVGVLAGQQEPSRKYQILARLDAILMALKECKVGLFASAKTKSALEQKNPAILQAIEKYDPAKIPRSGNLSGT